MQMSGLSALNAQVLWASFLLSVALGGLLHRTHFCTLGAMSDIVLMADWTRMRQWILAIGVAMLGFAWLVYAGWVDPTKVLYASQRWLWLSALVGGFMFGVGMVLASGCASKTLVRLGGGNLKSLLVLLVVSVSAFATLKGVTAVLRVNTVDRIGVDFAAGASLAQLASAHWGVSPTATALWLGAVLGTSLVIGALWRADFLQPNNLFAGIGVGALVTAMWWLSGHWGFVPEHPETLEQVFVASSSGRAESLSFVAPMAYLLHWLMFFSDQTQVLKLGIVSVLGVVLGATLNALLTNTFRWEGFRDSEDLTNHLIGAVLMGVGGVTAMGCTIGQGVSGVATLSLTSFVALGAIWLGAWAGLQYQVWRVARMA